MPTHWMIHFLNLTLAYHYNLIVLQDCHHLMFMHLVHTCNHWPLVLPMLIPTPASSESLSLEAGLQSTNPSPITPAACYPNDYQCSPVASTFGSSPSPSLYMPPSCQSSSSNLVSSTSMLPLGLRGTALHQPWTDADRAWFSACLAQITASCGFLFSWVEDPEWLGFLQEFFPTAEPIKHQSLANHWIPLEVGKFRWEAKNHSQGLEDTIQCDGWSGMNFHHFIAFMITTLKRKVAYFESLSHSPIH